MNKREAKRAACRYSSMVLDGVLGTGGWADWFDDPDGPDAVRFCAAMDELTQELFNRGDVEDGNSLFRSRVPEET